MNECFDNPYSCDCVGNINCQFQCYESKIKYIFSEYFTKLNDSNYRISLSESYNFTFNAIDDILMCAIRIITLYRDCIIITLYDIFENNNSFTVYDFSADYKNICDAYKYIFEKKYDECNIFQEIFNFIIIDIFGGKSIMETIFEELEYYGLYLLELSQNCIALTNDLNTYKHFPKNVQNYNDVNYLDVLCDKFDNISI